MNTAAEILLLIVSATLSIFLLLGIVVLVKVLQILQYTKRIASKAEQIADKAEAVSEFFQKTAGPAAIVKLVSNIVHAFNVKNTGRKQRERGN